MSLVEQLTFKDLPTKENLITIDPSDNIPTAFQKIFSNRISSAPVVDKKQNLVGCIGIIDIVLFSLNVCQTSQELAIYFGLPTEGSEQFVDFEPLKNYLTPDNNVHQSAIADSAQFITNYSHQNLLHVIRPDCAFKDVVHTLTKAHRIAIGDDNIVNYVSQFDVVKLLKERGAFSDINAKLIEELKLGSKNVISVNQNQRVIEAFKLMIVHKISGVAVIDDDGHLQGQISISDIKGITTSGEMLPRLYETYHPYRKILVEKYNAPEKTITAPSGSLLSDILETIISNRLHRIFIVTQDQCVDSVISLCDVLKLIDKN